MLSVHGCISQVVKSVLFLVNILQFIAVQSHIYTDLIVNF